MPTRVYVEDPAFHMAEKFLAGDLYAQAMESLVIVGSDIIVIDRAEKSVYLLRRKARPMQGKLWFIGGRMYAGERAEATAIRRMKQETSVELSADRLQYLCLNRYVWRQRQQEPRDKGSDNLCFTFAVELTPEERATAAQNIDTDEYDANAGLKAFDRGALIASDAHRAIIDLYDLVFGK